MYEGHIKKDIKYWKIPRDSDEIGRLMQFFPVLLQLTLLLSLPHIYAFHSLYGNLADVLSLLHSLYIYLVFTHLSRLQGFCRVPQYVVQRLCEFQYNTYNTQSAIYLTRGLQSYETNRQVNKPTRKRQL